MALMLNSRMSARRYSAEALCQPPNKQLEADGQTSTRWPRGHAAAQLRHVP
jgi:hypothetical protein